MSFWRARGSLAVLVVLTLWRSGIAVAAPQPGRLAGTVKNALNEPLAEVTIRLDGGADQEARTDAAGRFQFDGLPAGRYDLIATLAGFAPARRTVQLTTGGPTTVSLTLQVLVQEHAVVTASRTGERDSQTVPMAVTVRTGTELQQAEAHNLADIVHSAPSMAFSQNSDFAQLTIRGIGSNVVFAGTDPSSAVYVDGVYLSRPVAVGSDFLDLERVEVLRGPQGTLYGRNAVGGAVNLITKSPTNTLDASARFVAGNLGAFRTEARVSGPIVRGRILGSAAILHGVRDGFVRDLDHPDHPLGGEDVTALRTKLHVIFNRHSNLLLSGEASHQDPTPLNYAKVLAVKPGFEVDNPSDLHAVRTSTPAEGRILQHSASARFTANLPARMTLTSLTAFRKLEYSVVNDADITELDLTSVHLQEFQHQWTEELTVSQQRTRMSWIAGLFVFDETDRQPTTISIEGPRLENFLDPRIGAETQAVFGQATFDVAPRLSATAGLRYSREHKTIDNAGQISALDPPGAVVPGSAYSYSDDIAHTAWTPKVGVDFRARENLLAYVSATRGFKSGGFNFTSPEAGRGYAPEWAWSYEGGVKSTINGGRSTINAAVFQTDYTDLQVQTAIRPGVIDISNAAAATIRGAELEGTTRVTTGLTAGGHLTWLSARYDRYVAVGVGGVTGDVAGNRLSNVPEWSGRAWLQWSGSLRSTGLLTLRADAAWQSTVFFTPFNDSIQRQDSYALLGGSAELGPIRRHWSISVWARNLTNTDYITGSFSTPPPAIGGRPGIPRQAGIQLTLRP